MTDAELFKHYGFQSFPITPKQTMPTYTDEQSQADRKRLDGMLETAPAVAKARLEKLKPMLILFGVGNLPKIPPSAFDNPYVEHWIKEGDGAAVLKELGKSGFSVVDDTDKRLFMQIFRG